MGNVQRVAIIITTSQQDGGPSDEYQRAESIEGRRVDAKVRKVTDLVSHCRKVNWIVLALERVMIRGTLINFSM